MEYSTLSDRELDFIVEQRIFDGPKPPLYDPWWYRTHHCGESGYRPGEDYCPKCHGVDKRVSDMIEADDHYKDCPHYSTDITDAFAVFEKLRQSGEFCCLTIDSDYSYCWDVRLTSAVGDDEHKPCISVGHESLPRAICIAALLAHDRMK